MEDVDSAPGGRPAGAGNRRPTGLLGRRRRKPGTDRLRVREVGLDHPDAAAAWSRLSDEGAPTTPFETWQWGSALADVPTLAAAGGVLLAEAGPVGRPGALGLLPIDRRRGPAGPRVLRALGADWLAPDHLDVIAAPQNRAAVARAVTRFLRQRSAGWDLLDLEGVREDGALATALGALGPPGFLALPAEEVRAPYVRLWPDPASGWSRNLRQQIARGLRAAHRAGGGFSVVDHPDAVVALLEELMRLHNARFGAASAVFATPERRRFHRLAARRLAQRRGARIYRLTAGGVDAALLYALALGDTVYYYSMGITPDAAPSPGRTVLGQAILAAADEGAREFDLLRGDHEFKLRFASGRREDRRLRVVRLGPAGVRHLGSTALRRARRWVSLRSGGRSEPWPGGGR